MQLTTALEDSIGIVTLQGDFNAAQVNSIRDSFKEWFDGNHGIQNVIMDFEGVGMIDSAGLGLLIALLKHVTNRGGDLKLVGLQKKVRLVFEITRTHRIFEIMDSIEEAKNALS